MTQQNGKTPSLEDYTRREYVHKRLAETIPTEYKDLSDYRTSMGIFQLGFSLAMNKKGKKPIIFNFKGDKTPAIEATMIASSALYDLGYEIGEASSRYIATGLAKEGTEHEVVSTFTLKIETILEHISTYLYPNVDTPKVRVSNRNNPLLKFFLPPTEVM